MASERSSRSDHADGYEIIVRLVANERLGRDPGTGLIAGIEGRRWQGLHGSQIAFQPFTDRLALTAQPVALALAALFFQKGIERIPPRKLRDGDHEVTPGITDKALDIPLVIALSGAAIAIPDQVVGPLNSVARLRVPSGRIFATRQRSLS